MKVLNYNQLTDQQHANIIGGFALGMSAIAQFALAPVVKYYLGAEGLGLWYLIFQTFMYLQLIDIGLSNSIVREIAVANSSKHNEDLANLNATAKRMLMWVGIGFFSIGAMLSLIIPTLIEMPDTLKNDFILSIFMLAAWGSLDIIWTCLG